MTGPPDPAQPARAEREAYTDAAIRQAAELRRHAASTERRLAGPAEPPDRPSDRQLAPWEAVMAGVCSRTSRSGPRSSRCRPRRTTPRTPATS